MKEKEKNRDIENGRQQTDRQVDTEAVGEKQGERGGRVIAQQTESEYE